MRKIEKTNEGNYITLQNWVINSKQFSCYVIKASSEVSYATVNSFHDIQFSKMSSVSKKQTLSIIIQPRYELHTLHKKRLNAANQMKTKADKTFLESFIPWKIGQSTSTCTKLVYFS